MTDDATFTEHSMTGSQRWVATRLGRSYDWFSRNKARLERHGFPRPDPILGMWIKADVEAWIANRRQVADAAQIQQQEPNYDAL